MPRKLPNSVVIMMFNKRAAVFYQVSYHKGVARVLLDLIDFDLSKSFKHYEAFGTGN